MSGSPGPPGVALPDPLNADLDKISAIPQGWGGLYRAEFLCHKFCAEFLSAICSAVFTICTGIRQAVPLLIYSMPEDLVHDDSFPMEVAEVLTLSFLICRVPVAFNEAQTSALVDGVDAPGKSSEK